MQPSRVIRACVAAIALLLLSVPAATARPQLTEPNATIDGAKVTVQGAVTQARPATTVRLQQRKGKRWIVRGASQRLRAGGAYSLSWRAVLGQRVVLRVVARRSGRVVARSRQLKLTVTTPSPAPVADPAPGVDDPPPTSPDAPEAAPRPVAPPTAAPPVVTDPHDPDHLAGGQQLTAGRELESSNRHFKLKMQADGNLVLYEGSRAHWSTGTGGRHGARAELQGDGNLVIYQGSTARWTSDTYGFEGAKLKLHNDGRLTIERFDRTLWTRHAGYLGDRLTAGSWLRAGDVLHSHSHRYRLVMQGDSNLVLYEGTRALWATGTNGTGGAAAVMQGDGNLVLYRGGAAIWASHTAGRDGQFLIMQNDANAVIYGGGGAIWSRTTGVIGGGGGGPSTPDYAERAIRWAEARIGERYTSLTPDGVWSGWCEAFVSIAYERRYGRFASAMDHLNARRAAGQLRGGVPPRGAIVYYDTYRPWGHVAISAGGGQVVSTQGASGALPVYRTGYTTWGGYAGWWMP